MGILIKAPARRREGPPPVNVLAEKGESAAALHIREVVRITGLRREQLYMWQRRYGFPAPLRDTFGDRVYPPDQVGRLKLIKQLLSEGWRAGAVVPLAETALQSMLGLTIADATPLPAEIDAAVRLLGQHRILELLLFTEGANCLTLGAGVPAQEIAGATKAYKPALVVLLFDRGISGKIAGQEIRSLRQALPVDTPLIVSGRAVNLLAKPIENAQVAADFNSVIARMRSKGLPTQDSLARLEGLPEPRRSP